MSHHKRGKPKKQRGHAGQGCPICYFNKEWKMNGVRKDKYRPSERRRTQEPLTLTATTQGAGQREDGHD